MIPKKFWKVNKSLLPIKFHYFMFFAALGCNLPFRTVFAKQLGTSATAVGIIFLAIPFTKIITNPFFGFIVDYFKSFRFTITTLLMVIAITTIGMLYVPPYPNANDFNHLNMTASYSCDRNVFFKLSGKPDLSQIISSPEDRSIRCKLHCQSSLDSSEKYENLTLRITDPVYQNISIESNVSVRTNECYFDMSLLYSDETSIRFGDSLSQVHVNKLASNLYTESFPCKCMEKLQSSVPYQHTKTIAQKSTDCSQSDNLYELSSVHFVKENNHSVPCPYEQQLQCQLKDCQLQSTAEEFHSVQFWSLFFFLNVSSIAFCAVIFLVDTVCYEMLPNGGFSMQRLWGSIGWGLGSFVAGCLNTEDGEHHVDYSLSFWLLGVLLLIDVLPVYKMKLVDLKYSKNICKDIGILLSNPNVVGNILLVFMIGVLSGLVWNYQFWFLEEIGASQVLLGLSQAFECILSELPSFLVADWVISKVGLAHCNDITLICLGLRYICFFYMQDPWLILPVSLLAGPAFGIFFTAMTRYGKQTAPPGAEASMQALLSMAFEGIGAGAGSILGGLAFDAFGSRTTFLYAGIVSFVLLLINVLLHLNIFNTKSDAHWPSKHLETKSKNVRDQISKSSVSNIFVKQECMVQVSNARTLTKF